MSFEAMTTLTILIGYCIVLTRAERSGRTNKALASRKLAEVFARASLSGGHVVCMRHCRIRNSRESVLRSAPRVRS